VFTFSAAATPLNFGPSLACLDTPEMRGYGHDSASILCSTDDKVSIL
jgi:hypothetical protein